MEACPHGFLRWTKRGSNVTLTSFFNPCLHIGKPSNLLHRRTVCPAFTWKAWNTEFALGAAFHAFRRRRDCLRDEHIQVQDTVPLSETMLRVNKALRIFCPMLSTRRLSSPWECTRHNGHETSLWRLLYVDCYDEVAKVCMHILCRDIPFAYRICLIWISVDTEANIGIVSLGWHN